MRYIDLGLSDYKEAYRFQREVADNVAAGTFENTLIITEHRSVITIGRLGSEDNIFKRDGIDVLRVDRGGDVTYHCPGQLVAYPIFRLENEARDIHGFLRFLEEVGINFLGKYGVKGEARQGARGVWVGDSKIASIGIGVKKWVTYHGMAINVNPDLRPFSFIKPCGMDGVRMITLKELLDKPVNISDAKDRLKESFEEIFLPVEV